LRTMWEKCRRRKVSRQIVYPTRFDIYNNCLMHIAKYTYPLMIPILSLGLLYVQVCNIICVFSHCSVAVPIEKRANAGHPSHCHRDQPSQQQEQPSDKPQKCPSHNLAFSIPPPETISTALSHQLLQPATAELYSSIDISFSLAGSWGNQRSHFRSPPQRPQFTILRI
jgi:hypothetical protein